jgi:hypothetical protein
MLVREGRKCTRQKSEKGRDAAGNQRCHWREPAPLRPLLIGQDYRRRAPLDIKAIQVIRPRHVSLHCRYVAADVGYGRVQFGLAAPRVEDMSAFDNEGFRPGEADVGIAAGDDSDLPFKLSHNLHNLNSRRYRWGVTKRVALMRAGSTRTPRR